MDGFNRFIDEDQYSKPTRTFTIHSRACLIILDVSL
jgi:hypothetical protein